MTSVKDIQILDIDMGLIALGIIQNIAECTESIENGEDLLNSLKGDYKTNDTVLKSTGKTIGETNRRKKTRLANSTAQQIEKAREFKAELEQRLSQLKITCVHDLTVQKPNLENFDPFAFLNA